MTVDIYLDCFHSRGPIEQIVAKVSHYILLVGRRAYWQVLDVCLIKHAGTLSEFNHITSCLSCRRACASAISLTITAYDRQWHDQQRQLRERGLLRNWAV